MTRLVRLILTRNKLKDIQDDVLSGKFSKIQNYTKYNPFLKQLFDDFCIKLYKSMTKSSIEYFISYVKC